MRGGIPIGTKKGLKRCQVGSETESPCTALAVTERRGVPLCGQCARERDAYAAIDELTQAQGLMTGWIEQVRRLRNEQLVELMDRMQGELARRTAGAVEHLRRVKREARRPEDASHGAPR